MGTVMFDELNTRFDQAKNMLDMSIQYGDKESEQYWRGYIDGIILSLKQISKELHNGNQRQR